MANAFQREEQGFLSGRRSRWQELKYALGVVAQFVRGFRVLHFVDPCITIFGSARFNDEHPYYQWTRELAGELGKAGFAIMTGGGPGIMEAANRGARDVGAVSLGCNIVLPMEQHENPYLDRFVNIDYFFVRKELLRKYSMAFVVMPGGFGTLDEFFETLTLIQTKKTEAFPMVVMGLEYHKHLREHIALMSREHTISPEDMNLILFTDSVSEAANHILKYAGDQISEYHRKHAPNTLLGETAVR